MNSLKSLTAFLTKREELVDCVGADLLKQVLKMMKDKDSEVHSTALRFVSHCFSSDDSKNIDLALDEDILATFDELLSSPSTEIIIESLWGLSNVTASNDRHAAAFLQEESLY